MCKIIDLKLAHSFVLGRVSARLLSRTVPIHRLEQQVDRGLEACSFPLPCELPDYVMSKR